MRFIDDTAPMKSLLTIVSGAVLALAAVVDPTTRGHLVNLAVATAWAQQDRGRGHDDRDRDRDREKDRDRDDDRDRHEGKDRDEDKERDNDKDRDDDKVRDADQDRDDDRDRDRGNDDKDQDDDRGGGKDKDQDDDRGGSNEGEGPGGGDDPGNDDQPDVDDPREGGEPPDVGGGNNDNAGADADFADRGAEPAERGADDDLNDDPGELAGRFDLDDTETFDDDGFLARRGEIIALSADPQLARRAAALGLEVVEREALTSLNATMYRLTVPAASPIDGILARLRSQDPSGVFDRNHLYDRSAASSSPSKTSAPPRALMTKADGITIGLIDTGVDVLHPALNGTLVELRYFTDDDSRALPESHGTAVVSLLVSPEFGVLPGAQLYVACVFYADRRGGLLSEAQDLVRALDWLMERRVPVINMSLSGPPNEVLRATVNRALQAGHLVVAAVGNAGPASPPLYPAAYEGVIGVTAVDAGQHVFRRANRGTHVEFAAVGVDVLAAAPGGLSTYSGTSFASPYIAALAAMDYRSLDAQKALAVREGLRSNALDLGEPGRDEVYGFGLARPRTISTAAR
jgi:hypothetical protein